MLIVVFHGYCLLDDDDYHDDELTHSHTQHMPHAPQELSNHLELLTNRGADGCFGQLKWEPPNSLKVSQHTVSQFVAVLFVWMVNESSNWSGPPVSGSGPHQRDGLDYLIDRLIVMGDCLS